MKHEERHRAGSALSPAPIDTERTAGSPERQFWPWLAFGAALALLAGFPSHLSILSWVSTIPFLIAVRKVRSAGAALALGAVALLSAFPWTAKSISPPISIYLVPAFAAPMGFVAALQICLSEVIRRRTSDAAGALSYAALVGIGDWAWPRFTAFGVWPAMGNTQFDSLTVAQFAALFGVPGIGFLMGFFQGSAAAFISTAPYGVSAKGMRSGKVLMLAASATLFAALLFGAMRLARPEAAGPYVTAAAVATEFRIGGTGRPGRDVVSANTEKLFELTRTAALRGARLVAWNETATLAEPEEEAALIDRGRKAALDLGVDLVMAYGVVVTPWPFLLDNKFAFITDEGEAIRIYRKRHLIPFAEHCLVSREPLSVVRRPYGGVAGGICLDFDFPDLVRELARTGADLAAVPSSDWEGIDPMHSLFARFRAIEQGISILRPVRDAASFAFDSRGRVLGSVSKRASLDEPLVAVLPAKRFPTPYSRWGDLPIVALCSLIIALSGLAALRGRKGAVDAASPISDR